MVAGARSGEWRWSVRREAPIGKSMWNYVLIHREELREIYGRGRPS